MRSSRKKLKSSAETLRKKNLKDKEVSSACFPNDRFSFDGYCGSVVKFDFLRYSQMLKDYLSRTAIKDAYQSGLTKSGRAA